MNTLHACKCRAQLDELTAAMTDLRANYEEHAQLVASAEEAALNVQQGAAELDAMRKEQQALSQRIALLQGLLQARPPPAYHPASSLSLQSVNFVNTCMSCQTQGAY